MKIGLMVLTEGKSAGRTIPITLSQFIIGRDPQCQLRPSSPLISKRHCAVIVRGSKLFVRDFDSTNGTFVNDEQVKGERELKNNDLLKAGPLSFKVVVEGTPVPVNKPTPLPKTVATTQASQAAEDDDSMAAMMLDNAGDEKPATPSEEEVGGTTTVEMTAPSTSDTAENKIKPPEEAKPEAKPDAKKPAKKQDMNPDTSAAANAILQKYMRRTR